MYGTTYYGGAGEVGEFPAGWACWNGNYRDSIRLYVAGNYTGFVNGAGDLGYADAFYGDTAKGSRGGAPEVRELLVCHDGFNMTDFVSYGSRRQPCVAVRARAGGRHRQQLILGRQPGAPPAGHTGLLDVPGPEPGRPDDGLGRRVRADGEREQQLLQRRFGGHLEQL